MAWQYLKQINAQGDQRDITICTPNLGTVSYEWATKLRHLNPVPGLSWATIGYSGQPVDIARNICITNSLRLQAKYIFFLDADVLVYPDTLVNLHKKNLPIVSGTYINRGLPYNIVANVGKQSLPGNMLQSQQVPVEPVEVDETGAGCLLIDTRVLYRLMDMKIVDTWYCLIDHNPKDQKAKKEIAIYNSKEARAANYLCPRCKEVLGQQNIILGDFFTYNIMRDKNEFEGEDYNFCKKVKRTGIQIRLDLNNVVGHEVYRLIVDQQGMHNTTTPVGGSLHG